MLTDEMTARISSLLSREGCAECYIFGSHVTGGADAGSDIDIGVVGFRRSGSSRFCGIWGS